MLRRKWVLWLVLTASAGLLWGCPGDDATDEGAKPPDAGPPAAGPSVLPSDTPEPPVAPLPEEADPAAPPGDVPVPPPAPFAASDLRSEADKDGAFEGLPAAQLESLPALMKAFAKAAAEAKEKPGEQLGTPVGPNYFPSPAEIRAAELADRIARVVALAPKEKVAAAWKASGIEEKAIEYKTFVEITVPVRGTGYMKAVEARTEKLVPAE